MFKSFEASDLLSSMLLSRVLYSTAPLYWSDCLLTHKSLLGTYNWLDWLDRGTLDDICETFYLDILCPDVCHKSQSGC